MNRQLNLAIVGCGRWGMNYVRVFHELVETHIGYPDKKWVFFDLLLCLIEFQILRPLN